MELMDAIKGRRSIRKFTDEPIPQDKLEYCIEAALWAPSGQNLQPWRFVVLRKDEDLRFLFDELGTTAFSERKHLEQRFPTHPEVVEETMEFRRELGGAHTIVLAFLHKHYSEQDTPSCLESVGAAMQNMCLAAYEQGIATCWVETVKQAEDALIERFAPDAGGVVGAVVMGYPAMEAREVKRKPGRVEWR